MKNKWLYLLIAVSFIISAFFPNGVQHVTAQPPQPPEPIKEPVHSQLCLPGENCWDKDLEILDPNFSEPEANLAFVPLATGGPDDFGYTWNDTISFNWIDAKTGTDTGLSGDDNFQQLDIGFPFKFYENTYTQLYVTTNGLVTFQVDAAYSWSNTIIPNSSLPNNLIAPFWDDLGVSWEGYNTGKVSIEGMILHDNIPVFVKNDLEC